MANKANPFTKKAEAAELKTLGKKGAAAEEKAESPAERKREAKGNPFAKKGKK